MEKKYLTQSDFAKTIGKTRQYITKLKNEGKIIFNKDGLVDVTKTNSLLKKMSDPSKSKKIINKVDIPEDVKGNLTEEEINDILENEDPSNFNQSKSRKEYFLSKISELNFLKESGKLIETDLVELQYFNIARQLRDQIFNIKYRVASQLSIMTEVNDISNLLEKEFRLAFSESEKFIEEQLKQVDTDEEE